MKLSDIIFVILAFLLVPFWIRFIIFYFEFVDSILDKIFGK